MHHPEFLAFPISICGSVSFFYLKNRLHIRKMTKQLSEFNEAPFPFKVKDKHGSDYIVFHLDDGLDLWGEFEFGIRSDGIYGVEKLKLKGLNTIYSSSIELKIGQSVFPIISKMEEFTEWADKKAFKTEWEGHFNDHWNDMKKKLNNLRYLEAKSKEKDKKSK